MGDSLLVIRKISLQVTKCQPYMYILYLQQAVEPCTVVFHTLFQIFEILSQGTLKIQNQQSLFKILLSKDLPFSKSLSFPFAP